MTTSDHSARPSDRVEQQQAKSLVSGSKRNVSDDDFGTPHLDHRRTSRARAEAIIADLTGLEVAVVSTLGRLRLATGGQLQRLHFEASPSGQRHARRVLAGLADLRVVARLGRRIGGKRSGSTGFVYVLDVVGQRMLDPGADVRAPWTPSEGFVHHAAMVSECYVQLREAERIGPLELLDFEAEPACYRPYVDRRGSHQLLRPDAFVRVAVGEFEDRWMLECDRATEDIPRVLAKCRRYVGYWRTGKEAVFPRVLWVTPREPRVQALTQGIARLPSEERQLFAVCRESDFRRTIAAGAGEADQ